MVWSFCCCTCIKVHFFFSSFSSILDFIFFLFRDLARIHRRKYRGPVEIYVTSGDTIYITEAEKTFFSQSILPENDQDLKEEEKESQIPSRQRQINLRNKSQLNSSDVQEEKSNISSKGFYYNYYFHYVIRLF